MTVNLYSEKNEKKKKRNIIKPSPIFTLHLIQENRTTIMETSSHLKKSETF